MPYEKELNEYMDNLWDKQIGKEARDYLKQRHIKPSTAKAWNIGWCPKDFKPKCYSDTDYPYYMKMQGRIILPVYNSNGELIALSGRTIYKDIKPKYMHYQFPTSFTLFGLFINEKNILQDNYMIFTEGQFDVISAWQNGLKNVACTFGAHFSSNQILLASRYTNNVLILYDADIAGQEGASKALQKIKVRGDVKIKLLTGILKNGEDLDNWVQHNNVNLFKKIAHSNQESLLKYRLQAIKE